MFFRNYSTYEGEPARLYRSPKAIREDILDIKTRIDTVNAQLNVRDVLASVLDGTVGTEPERWIPTLSDLVAEAEEALSELKSLKESLDILSEELEDSVWAVGV